MKTSLAEKLDSQTTVKGKIAKVFYCESGFCAGVLSSSEASIRFAGPYLVKEDDPVIFTGTFQNTKWGRQLRVESYEPDMKLDREGLGLFLSKSKRFSGIGKARAKKIIEKFGDRFDQVVTKDPGKLTRIKGITPEIAKNIRNEWNARREYGKAISYLSRFGLTPHQVEKLIENLGDQTLPTIINDPYTLIDLVEGFGFRRVDDMALKLGVSKDNSSRLQAGLLYTLFQASDEGHTCLEKSLFLLKARQTLILDSEDAESLVRSAQEYLEFIDKVVTFRNDGTLWIALSWLHKMESFLHRILSEHGCEKLPLNIKLSPYLKGMTDGQKKAFTGAVSHKMYLITGPGGTGKTYLIDNLVKYFHGQKLYVALTAPTGKAAKRMEQATGETACTIHRLLGYNGVFWRYGKDNKLESDVIIIDEVSMTDVPLLYRLFSAIDFEKTRVILSGDHNQLPPVGPGNPLRDIIKHNLIPYTVLCQVVRQAGILRKNSLDLLYGRVARTIKNDNPTLLDWILIDKFDDPDDGLNYILHLYENVFKEKLGYDIVKGVQVLSPQRKGVLGILNLNIAIQSVIQKKLFNINIPPVHPNKRPLLYPGDKVMQIKNDYNLGVMNGHMGYVIDADPKKKQGIIDFEDKGNVKITRDKRDKIILAYASTIHKFQGSEIPCVVCVMHSSHSFMLHRNLFYTAVTRAKERVIIIGDSKGVYRAARRQRADNRITLLSKCREADL